MRDGDVTHIPLLDFFVGAQIVNTFPALEAPPPESVTIAPTPLILVNSGSGMKMEVVDTPATAMMEMKPNIVIPGEKKTRRGCGSSLAMSTSGHRSIRKELAMTRDVCCQAWMTCHAK